MLFSALMLVACATKGTSGGGGGDTIDPAAEQDELELKAYEATGDVRVTYYVKDTLLPGAGGRDVQQDELLHVLLNKSHNFYRGVPDHQIKKEERFLYNSDMYDLLKILQELGFFAKGASVNIFSDDPIERADNERVTSRMISVQTIKDGKVNTSYFSRRINEHELDAERARLFNDCQAVVLQAIAGALPHSRAGYGDGDKKEIDNRRR